MSTTHEPETPAQALARQIVARLVDMGLLTAAEAARLQPKLAEGKLKAEDWRLAIELSTEHEVRP